MGSRWSEFGEDLGASLPFIGGFFQAANARDQIEEGERMRNEILANRAAGKYDYSTPGEVVQSLALAKNAYLNPNMPGMGIAKNDLSASTSQQVGLSNTYGRSPSDIIAGITGAGANQNRSLNELNVASENFRIGNRDKYMGQLGQMGEYKDKEWAYNIYMPMMQDRQYAESMIGAGNKNLYNSQQRLSNDIFKTASLAVGEDGFNLGDMFESIFGSDKKK